MQSVAILDWRNRLKERFLRLSTIIVNCCNIQTSICFGQVDIKDIEQLVSVGEELRACPLYYGTRFPIPPVQVRHWNSFCHLSGRLQTNFGRPKTSFWYILFSWVASMSFDLAIDLWSLKRKQIQNRAEKISIQMKSFSIILVKLDRIHNHGKMIRLQTWGCQYLYAFFLLHSN